MASPFSFEKLQVYQKAVTFSCDIYQITKTWPKEHLFSLTDQIRRASLSISLNIAEGYARTRKDFQHFLTISRGSCFECIPLIKIATSLEILSPDQEQKLYNQLDEISRMLGSLRTSIKLNSQSSSLSS